MADTKITALTTITGAALAAGDLFLVIDVSDTTMDAAGTAKVVDKASLATELSSGPQGDPGGTSDLYLWASFV